MAADSPLFPAACRVSVAPMMQRTDRHCRYFHRLLAPEAVDRVRTNPYINAKGESDLTATVAVLLDEGRELRGWTLDGEWLDGGTLEGLLHAQSRLLAGIEAGSRVSSTWPMATA